MYTQCQHNQVNGKSLTTRLMGVCFFCLLILNVHFPTLVTRYVVILKTPSYNPHKKMVLKKHNSCYVQTGLNLHAQSLLST